MATNDDSVGSTAVATAVFDRSAGKQDAEAFTKVERRGPATAAPAATGLNGELQIKALLGEGGMAKVYLAFDPVLGREVALKELSEDLARADLYRSGFVAEAQVNAGLNHPGIVPVYALTAGPGTALRFTMQAVKGKTLRAWMDSPEHPVGGQERLATGLEIFLKVCDALAYAHSRGILHCDLKPENVMIGDYGSCYLMDWGLSRPLIHNVPTGVCGTPGYMSPEQARNEPLDERSDIFGLGAILFELVSGATPYGNGSAEVCHARAGQGNVADIMETVRGLGISGQVCRIIQKAVAPAGRDRHPTVAALRDEVHSFVRGGFALPRRTVKAGELLVREGDLEDTAYMLLSGLCRVFRNVGGRDTTLREMGAGEILGELSLLLGSARTASVEALEDCIVLVIDRATVESSGAMEGWTAALMRALARRFRETELRPEVVLRDG